MGQVDETNSPTAAKVAGEGFEPSTLRLWVSRATNCSTPQYKLRMQRAGFEPEQSPTFLRDSEPSPHYGSLCVSFIEFILLILF